MLPVLDDYIRWASVVAEVDICATCDQPIYKSRAGMFVHTDGGLHGHAVMPKDPIAALTFERDTYLGRWHDCHTKHGFMSPACALCFPDTPKYQKPDQA